MIYNSNYNNNRNNNNKTNNIREFRDVVFEDAGFEIMCD